MKNDRRTIFGWAMYAVPNLRVNVRAARIETPSASAEPDWNAISVASYREMRAFAERRERWGALLPPDRLADKLFRAQPDLPGVLIRVTRWVISDETSRLESENTDYVYAPPGSR